MTPPEFFTPNLEALQANDPLVRGILMHIDQALTRPTTTYVGRPESPDEWYLVTGMRSDQHAENVRQLAVEITDEIRGVQAQYAEAFPDTASDEPVSCTEAVYTNRLDRSVARKGPTYSVRQLGIVSMTGVTTHDHADQFRFDWSEGGELGSLTLTTLAETPVQAEYALIPDETEYVIGCMELFSAPVTVDKILSGEFKDEAELEQLMSTLLVPEGAEEILASMKTRALRTHENKLLIAAHNLAMPGTREFEEVLERLQSRY